MVSLRFKLLRVNYFLSSSYTLLIQLKMPKRFRRKRKSKFVTRRALPFLLMKQAEAKFVNVNPSIIPLDVDSSSTVTLDMTAISEGNARNNRIGQAIQTTGVFFKCTFGLGLVSQVTDARYARVVLYSTREANSAPDLNVAPMEFPDFDKYIIWSDKTVPVPWTNNLSNSMVTIRKKFRPYMKTLYDASGSGSVEKNNLRIMISTDADPGNVISVRWHSRLYFRDL